MDASPRSITSESLEEEPNIQSPEINKDRIDQAYTSLINWFLTKVLRPFNEERIVSSKIDPVKTDYPHAKELSWTFDSYHIQKRTQNGSKTWRAKTIKPRRKQRSESSWLWIWQCFLRYDTKSTSNKHNEK